MYGILLISPQAPPELITAARSRADFLAALKMRDTPHNWHRAVSDFTVAREVSGFYDARRALDEVRLHCPQHYLDCRFLLCRFLYRLASRRDGDFGRTLPLFA
ncbi:MAG TPA: hypothetical protein VKV03_11545 [Candidatus Binataceae bacterium]|nr:hypothetical protein [Candidatus Binataceae bacterium]